MRDAIAQPREGASAPRLISLTVVKNEQDIIEPFIRHNRRFLDAMIVVDNHSVDQTRQILISCARELEGVIVADDDGFAYLQSERMTRLLHGVQSAFFADFVFLLDADEFIGAPDRESLIQAISVLPAPGVGLLPWRTYVIAPSATGGEDPPRSLTWRRAEERPQYRKAVLRLDGRVCPDWRIEQGNHAVTTASGEPPDAIELDAPRLIHVPVRSGSQLISKSIVGWMAYLSRNPSARTEIYGFQWRDAFDRVLEDRNAFEGTALSEASLLYAQEPRQVDWRTDIVEDPHPYAYERRHSTGASADPLHVVARSWERSLAAPNFALEFRRPVDLKDSTPLTATAFQPTWHWDNLFVDAPPFQYLAEKYAPASVLDIGCGVGAYLSLFRSLGSRTVFGVDGLPREATVLTEAEYQAGNLGEPLDLKRIFDLVVCVEVAEHLDETASDTLLDSIARHSAGVIVFSAAEPGQPGQGHINCRPIGDWLQRWSRRGWVPDLVETLGVRSLASLSWFRRNLVVLRNRDTGSEADGADVLSAIGERPFRWYAQEPGVRRMPFREVEACLSAYILDP